MKTICWAAVFADDLSELRAAFLLSPADSRQRTRAVTLQEPNTTQCTATHTASITTAGDAAVSLLWLRASFINLNTLPMELSKRRAGHIAMKQQSIKRSRWGKKKGGLRARLKKKIWKQPPLPAIVLANVGSSKCEPAVLVCCCCIHTDVPDHICQQTSHQES